MELDGESSPEPVYEITILDEIEETLRLLEGSQISIVSASDLLLGPRTEKLIPFIVELWQRLLQRSHRSKKLAYVYLANDIIQKSLMMGSENYQKAFQPVIGKSLISLFEGQLRGEQYKEIKLDILKVINLWVKGRFFNELDELREKLIKIGKLD